MFDRFETWSMEQKALGPISQITPEVVIMLEKPCNNNSEQVSKAPGQHFE